jgi:hypothetical protein
MWNPTFETLFLLVGKLIALQFWVKTLCSFSGNIKEPLPSLLRLRQPYPLWLINLVLRVGPRFTPPPCDWHWLKGRILAKMWSGWTEGCGARMEPLSHLQLPALYQT